MKVQPELEYHFKGEFFMSSGKIIILEMKLFKLPNIKMKEFPEDYKFNWIAVNKDNPDELVLFDNHHGKAPHYHRNGEEEFFIWTSKSQVQELFFAEVRKSFGEFLRRIG